MRPLARLSVLLSTTLLLTTSAYSQTRPHEPGLNNQEARVYISLRKARELAAAQEAAKKVPGLQAEADTWMKAYDRMNLSQARDSASATRWERAFNGQALLTVNARRERDNARKDVGLWRGISLALALLSGYLILK